MVEYGWWVPYNTSMRRLKARIAMMAGRDDEQVISARMVFDVIGNLPGHDVPPVPVDVDLVYASGDPFVVRASFRTGAETCVEWDLARVLLAEGLHVAAGIGDVQVRPAPRDPSKVQLELSSPSGRAVLTTAADTLREFLMRSYMMVPAGSEAARLDIDLVLAVLLEH
jgi:hypothetical protein